MFLIYNYHAFNIKLPWRILLTNRSILEPLRRICLRSKAHFIQASVVDIDFANRLVECEADQTDSDEKVRFYVPYDKVIISVGAVSNTHGVKGLEYTHSLKTVDDVRMIRRNILKNLEECALPCTSDEERKRLLSLVVCGAGPTGIEFAAEIMEAFRDDYSHFFPHILWDYKKVTVLQGNSHVLNTFDESVSKYAERKFSEEDINIILNARVKEVKPSSVLYTLKDEQGNSVEKEIPTGMVLWSTGLGLSPLTETLCKRLRSYQTNKRAIITDAHCRVLGAPMGEVYAIGDCSTVDNNVAGEIISQLTRIAQGRGYDAETYRFSFEDWLKVCQHVRKAIPQASEHFKRFDKLFYEFDNQKNGKISMEEAQKIIKHIDSKLTTLPATAQRANQQGRYMAKKLNALAKARDTLDINIVENGDVDAAVYKAFSFRNLGTLAYLGDAAAYDSGNGRILYGGLVAMYLWRSIYFSEQVCI